jgi:hypothetical protein
MEDPKPQTGADSRTEITFPELHSSIYIGTAGARAFGRGDTIRKILLSEMSFYEDPETILSGVEDAVPLTGELTIECTPNGEASQATRHFSSPGGGLMSILSPEGLTL